MKRIVRPSIVLLLVLLGAGVESARAEFTCASWNRPRSGRTIDVTTVDELMHAVATAEPRTTILLGKGEYRLPRGIEITTPGLVLAGRRSDPSEVVLRGDGMAEGNVGVAVAIGASGVTIANLTVGWVRFHGIQIRGERGVEDVTIHDVRVVDTGQQLLKGSSADDGRSSKNVVVQCSLFEYTTHAPSDYTNGVDVLGGENWLVRDNRFRHVRGPEASDWRGGPAILFWGGSRGTVVERNLVVDSSRGIALGLTPRAGHDHVGGAIRNNVVVNLHRWADEGIEVNDAPGVEVDHNTVFTLGKVPWSISLRFPGTRAAVRNNLTNRAILRRDGGQSTEERGNVRAKPGWFTDLEAGDATLVPSMQKKIEAGADTALVPKGSW